MTHVFVAPHPDDVALSCGGLIASLRELGQNVTILTVFSGSAANGSGGLSSYQREALGFGSKAMWPATEAFNRSAIQADWPSASLVPSWAAAEDQLEATQADADAAAKRFWQRWYFWATHSRLAPMIEVARLIARHLPNVLTYFSHRITNAVAEGLNSKIATVQKRACGYRNPDHFKIAVYFHCGGLNLYPAP
jgi:hypothetical protein